MRNVEITFPSRNAFAQHKKRERKDHDLAEYNAKNHEERSKPSKHVNKAKNEKKTFLCKFLQQAKFTWPDITLLFDCYLSWLCIVKCIFFYEYRYIVNYFYCDRLLCLSLSDRQRTRNILLTFKYMAPKTVIYIVNKCLQQGIL